MNVERADILGRVCAVRSIFLSSRDASPRRATLNARSMGAREVTGVIPGKIGQSGAEIFTNGCGKKAIFERRDQGKLDRRFRISSGFPTTSPACILCGNYPIRLVGHRYLVRLFNRFWKWAHKNVWSPVCQNYAGNAQLTLCNFYLRLQPKNVLSDREEEDFVPLPLAVWSSVRWCTPREVR